MSVGALAVTAKFRTDGNVSLLSDKSAAAVLRTHVFADYHAAVVDLPRLSIHRAAVGTSARR